MQEAKVCVIVPAFNEEENIQAVISSLHSCDPTWQIMVINDASRDKTSAVARSTGLAHVVDLPCNLGIGGGVQTGFKFAHRQGFDIAIQFDGDGQHVATEIPRLIAPILEQKADVVIGSRFAEKLDDNFQSTTTRRIGIKFFQYLNSLLIHQRITDNTSGFRAYNKESLKLLAQLYPTDYPEPEAVILLGKNGFKIQEIPVVMKERAGGQSSITTFRSVYYMIKVTLSILITYIRPRVRH